MKILDIAVTACLMFAAPCMATAAPIDVTQRIVQLDGKDFKDANDKVVEFTLQKIIEDSLLGSYQDEQGLAGTEKMKRFQLAVKVHGSKAVTLTAEEISLIKTLVGKGYNALIVGQVWKMIDPESVK